MNSKKEPVVDDHEWDAQERGMRAARDRGTDALDSAAESYRRVAMALTSVPHREPPADFAAGIARQVVISTAGIERVLLRGLFVILAVSSVIVAALYGAQWWHSIEGAGGALRWGVAGAGCIALSWLIGRLHQPAEPGSGSRLSPG